MKSSYLLYNDAIKFPLSCSFTHLAVLQYEPKKPDLAVVSDFYVANILLFHFQKYSIIYQMRSTPCVTV